MNNLQRRVSLIEAEGRTLECERVSGLVYVTALVNRIFCPCPDQPINHLSALFFSWENFSWERCWIIQCHLSNKLFTVECCLLLWSSSPQSLQNYSHSSTFVLGGKKREANLLSLDMPLVHLRFKLPVLLERDEKPVTLNLGLELFLVVAISC